MSANRKNFDSSFVSIARPILLLAAIVFFNFAAGPAHAIEPVRPGQESSLIRAVFADGNLWLLSDAGELSVIAEDGNDRTAVDLSEPVLDLCRNNGQPMAITGTKGKVWTLRQRSGQHWSATVAIPRDADELLALSCTGGTQTILTTTRLIDIGASGAIHVTRISGKMHAGTISAIYDDGRHFFVGINAGEWGGGLQAILKSTGEVVSIERNISGELCGGPLNSACDPVTGIAPEPWKPGCMTAAVGLVHMMMHGRIVEVCGDHVRQLYSKTYMDGWCKVMTKKNVPCPETMAFFGLTASANALWAVGMDGVYRVDEHGAATIIPLPHFKTIGGIDVSFENDAIVFVLTSANQRHSVSGDVPLLVPRQ